MADKQYDAGRPIGNAALLLAPMALGCCRNSIQSRLNCASNCACISASARPALVRSSRSLLALTNALQRSFSCNINGVSSNSRNGPGEACES